MADSGTVAEGAPVSGTPQGTASCVVTSGIGLKFTDDLPGRMLTRINELSFGITMYLCLRVIGGSDPRDANTYVVRGCGPSAESCKDDSNVPALEQQFRFNYQQFLKRAPLDIQPSQAVDQAWATWKDIRALVADCLTKSNSFRFIKLDRKHTIALGGNAGTDPSMGSWSDTEVELDSWDLMNGSYSDDQAKSTWDGFWMILHEMLHCLYQLKGDDDVTYPPAGGPEEKLNQLRIGFGLKRRLAYAVSGSPGLVPFDGGSTFTFHTYPERKDW